MSDLKDISQTQVESLEDEFNKSLTIINSRPNDGIKILENIIDVKIYDINFRDEINFIKEKSIYELGKYYINHNNSEKLKELLTKLQLSNYFKEISKSKTGKIIRTLIDNLSKSNENTLLLQIYLCEYCIKWCTKENRLFLKQQIESRLCNYYLQNKDFDKSLKLMNKLIRSVKKIDDKHLLTEVHLIESKIQHALRNIPKAKAALTAARAASNSIYIGPLLQAEIDMQAGSLSMEEKDYKTGYSYFYEAFEGFDGLKDKRAINGLKYMLLSKIMNNEPNDVKAILSSKLPLKYKDISLDVMKNVANAYKERSLKMFEDITKNENIYNNVISKDLIIKNKLLELSDKLLQENLLKLLQPYSKVEIKHIAKLISLPIDNVTNKLSQMILDKKFNGILDQGSGAIIVFDDDINDNQYQYALQTINVLNNATDKLFDKATNLD